MLQYAISLKKAVSEYERQEIDCKIMLIAITVYYI